MNIESNVRRLISIGLCLWVISGSGCSSVDQESKVHHFSITGEVLREDRTPVGDVYVAISEEPKRKMWTTVPLASKIIAMERTDRYGRFELSFDASDRNRLLDRIRRVQAKENV